MTPKEPLQNKRQWWFRTIIRTRSHYQKKNHKWKAQKVKTYKGDLRNWGIPLTLITKETVQAKFRDNKNQKKKEVSQTLDKNVYLFKASYQHPNHHRKIRAKTQTRSNVWSTEFRFGEHHEERVGTNNLSLYPLFLKPWTRPHYNP